MSDIPDSLLKDIKSFKNTKNKYGIINRVISGAKYKDRSWPALYFNL